ncbi:MAG: hypothetical protein UV42_C0074G0003, partial [Candidatus Magasanikbacteria bacterium GW2011_GWE2_42_7]
LKAERAEVSRGVARGEIIPETAERRKEMAKFVMEMKSAQEIIDTFYTAYLEKDGSFKKDLSPEQMTAAVKALAEIDARIEFGDTNKVDTISYEGKEMQSLHTDLMLLRAQMKVALRKHLGVSREQFQTILEEKSEDFLSSLSSEKEDKDANEKKFRRKKVLRAALKGATLGMAFGIAAQEVAAFFNDDVDGAVEHIFNNSTESAGAKTTLASLFSWGEHSAALTPEASELAYLAIDHDAVIDSVDGSHLAIGLPKGFEVVNIDGVPTLATPDHYVVPLVFDASGGLDEATKNALHGIGLDTQNETFGSETIVTTSVVHETIPAHDYLNEQALNEPGWYQRTERSIWLGNDTPMTVGPDGKLHGADFNELRAYLAGEKLGIGKGFSGFKADGSAQMRIDMKEYQEHAGAQTAGSKHDSLIGKPGKALAEKRLFWELTPVKDGPTFQVPFVQNPDGTVTADISPDSPIYQMGLKVGADGKLIRDVYLSEIVEHPADGGRQLIYASGRGNGELADVGVEKTIVAEQQAFDNKVDISSVVPQPVAEGPETVPIIPIFTTGRKELEKASRISDITDDYLTAMFSEKGSKFGKNEISKTLKENPSAQLDQYKEIEDYFSRMKKSELRDVTKLAGQIDTPMGKDVKISVCIPAAGHQEGKHIYKTLESYLHQTLDASQYEINIFVNHPDRDQNGDKVQPDETLDEIERFKKDNPDVQVHVMYAALPLETIKTEGIGKVRKLLNSAVLMRHHERGPKASDLILVSSHADNLGINPAYLEEFLTQFEKHPEKDVFLGQIEWDPKAYAEWPEVYFGTKLFQYVDGVNRKKKMVGSSGANSAFRGSTYAAVGGHPKEKIAEDVLLGRKIIAARGQMASGGGQTAIGYTPRAMVYTSARRPIDVWKKHGISPAEQWFDFDAFDDLRTHELRSRGKEIDFTDPEARKELTDEFSPYKKILDALGVRYIMEKDESEFGSRVRVTDITRFVAQMQRYQELGDKKRQVHISPLAKRRSTVETYRASVKGEEKKKRDTQEAIVTSYDTHIQEFFREHGNLVFELPNTAVDIQELRASRDTILFGEYHIAKDHILTEQADSILYYAYKDALEDDNRVYVVKVEKDEKEKKSDLPEGIEDADDYLFTEGVTDETLVLPVQRGKLSDGKKARVYEASTMDLEKYLNEHDGQMDDPKTAIAIMLRVGSGVKTLHDHGVSHNDIATSNIVLTDKSAKLIDFDDASISKTKAFYRSAIKGNRYILAPELMHIPEKLRKKDMKRKMKFDKTADIYSMGATLYRIMAGKWPIVVPQLEHPNIALPKEPKKREQFYQERYEAYSQAHQSVQLDFPGTIPEALQAVIEKAMSPYPESRYQSVEEMSLALMDVYKTLS